MSVWKKTSGKHSFEIDHSGERSQLAPISLVASRILTTHFAFEVARADCHSQH